METHSKETARNSIQTTWEMRLAFVFLVLSTWLVFSASSFASESGETKHVLILYSFRYGLSANAMMDGNKVTSRAIQTTMEKGTAHDIAFHSERMDVSALPENRYFEELRDAYRKKYADQPIDLIIAQNYRALKFLINHGEELWPNTPILFGGVEEGRREQLKQLRPNITGIFGNARFGDMLDTIFKIHPDTQQIIVIIGASKTERFIETRTRQAFRKSVGRVDFTYLSDLGFDAILGRVSDLPPNSIVLFLTLIQDGEGKLVPENALPLISRVSNAPVYGLFDLYVGYGIVGGSVYSIEDRGIRIGKVGVRILAGEKPRDIPFGTGQRHLNLYDWRQLKRWGIAENDLPKGSIIRYQPLTFYSQYKWHIWGAVALIVIEAILINMLLFNRARRSRAERELQRAHHKLEETVTERIQQLQFEKLISRVSSEFINLPHDLIDNKIETGLKLVAEAFDFDRCLFHEFSENRQQLRLSNFYVKPGKKKPTSIITSADQPYLTKTMLKGDFIGIERIDDLPPAAKLEREYLMQQGVKSAFAIPLVVGNKPVGALTFTTTNREQSWPEDLIQRLKIVSEIFANALGRKQKEQKLRNAFSEIMQLKDRLQQENIYLQEEIKLEHKHGEIVGKSPAIKYVLRQAEQVAQTKSTVFLQGETGTGKELLAQMIHNLSSRKDRALMTVNCSALPPGLIESELFGREKGAYTGALTKQLGRFEIANGSTIFLDEISELPLELQAKLLRVLQDAKFERLGGAEAIEVDVRVIAATNRDLAKAMSEGSFREDLYYRLNVFPIIVPPLHERQEDIPLLVWAFVREFEKSMGKRITTIKQARMEEMKRYPWPGNVRELRNVVEQAMIVNKGRTLNLRVPETMTPGTSQNFSLQTLERNHIMTILEKSGWRVKGKNGAAVLLGLHPATLFSKMKKLGIKRTMNSDDISSRG
jgi:transcriptional regulator with GAF, ATPase, and Fis domain